MTTKYKDTVKVVMSLFVAVVTLPNQPAAKYRPAVITTPVRERVDEVIGEAECNMRTEASASLRLTLVQSRRSFRIWKVNIHDSHFGTYRLKLVIN